MPNIVPEVTTLEAEMTTLEADVIKRIEAKSGGANCQEGSAHTEL